MYDKILKNNTSKNSKSKFTPHLTNKIRENGVKSELRERKEPGEIIHIGYKNKYKNTFPHQSIDDIKSHHNKISLLQT